MSPPPRPIRFLYRLLQRFLTLDVTWLMTLERDDAEHRRRGQGGDNCRASVENVELRMLTSAEAESFGRDSVYMMPTNLTARLESGLDYCVGAIVDGRLASYAWYALDSIEATHNRGAAESSGVAFSFPSNTAFMYKGFTHPDFRGQGLYRAIQGFALNALADRGVTRILSTADWTNTAALASCNRLGFEPLGRVWVVGIRNWVWRRAPSVTRTLTIFGGSKATVTAR